MGADISYAVTVTATQVVVTRNVRAGICGPAETTARPATLADVDAWLADHEYRRDGEWALTESFEGLRVEATLTRAPRDMTAGLPREVVWNAPA